MKRKVIFTTLAMNQTTFFAGLGDELKTRGYDVAYIPFHERSVEFLKERGEEVFNVFEEIRRLDSDLDEDALEDRFTQLVEQYGIENPQRVLSHEKVSFEISSTADVKRKFCQYLSVLGRFVEAQKNAFGGDVTMVQEVGGFTSLLASYYAARGNGLDNVFMEPSFFRGRVFFVKNSYNALKIRDDESLPVSDEVRSYLDETIREKKIVIPKKDAWQFNGAIQKIFRPYNFKRLYQKLADKYVHGKDEEFNYIYSYVKRHARMLSNQAYLKSFYQEIPEGKFVYYPLHVPMDMALTVRSPEYLDQYSLLDFLARNVPPGYQVVVKEHPALVGAVSRSRVTELMKSNDNLVLLRPTINNYDVLEQADLVVTVNSKSGAEALASGKKVLVLGDAFYQQTRHARYVDKLGDVPSTMKELLQKEKKENGVDHFFQNVWNHSYPGEIYDDEVENLKLFGDSIDRYLTENC